LDNQELEILHLQNIFIRHFQNVNKIKIHSIHGIDFTFITMVSLVFLFGFSFIYFFCLAYFRVVSASDPVPHLPSKRMGFSHTATEVYYPDKYDNSLMLTCSSADSNGCTSKVIETKKGLFKSKIIDHRTYLDWHISGCPRRTRERDAPPENNLDFDLESESEYEQIDKIATQLKNKDMKQQKQTTKQDKETDQDNDVSSTPRRAPSGSISKLSDDNPIPSVSDPSSSSRSRALLRATDWKKLTIDRSTRRDALYAPTPRPNIETNEKETEQIVDSSSTTPSINEPSNEFDDPTNADSADSASSTPIVPHRTLSRIDSADNAASESDGESPRKIDA
jgi:hypothetical protein